MNEEEVYTLRAVSDKLGVSVYLLRRFCDLGLIRGVRRRRGGYRVLNEEQVAWVRTLIYLNRCGFGKKELKTYANLEYRGNETLGERKAMLETKRRQLWQTIEEAQENIDFIERKIELYDREIMKLDKQ